MSIRDKGPYWLMFPADESHSKFYTPEIQDKLVWHVARIEFDVPSSRNIAGARTP